MRTRVTCGMVILILAALPVLAQPIATESLSATSLSIAPQVAYERAVLRISGPSGYSGSRTFENGEAVHVDLLTFGRASAGRESLESATVGHDEAAMPEGRYKYETVFWSDGSKVGVQVGVFFVEGGLALSREANQEQLGDVRQDLVATGLASGVDAEGYTEATNVNDVLQILDTNGDDMTHLLLQADPPTASNWHLRNDLGDIVFREYDGSGFDERFTIEAGGRVGIGTTAPVAMIHTVNGNTPTLRLEQDGSSSFTPQTWDVAGNEANFFVRDATNGSTLPFRIFPGASSSSVSIAAGGLVGIGTSTPETRLHVRAEDPQVLVESTGAAAGRTLAYMKNSGDVRMFWENTTSGDIWQMSMLSTVLQMASPTGVGKFRVRKNAGLQALNGSTTILDLDAAGNLDVTSVTETSSREAKNGFESVDAQSVLEKVAGLPISEWSYKADSPGVRHLGPMSEDFHSAFGLGKTAKGITSVDTSGVALAAIQGLNQKLVEKDARISELEQRLLELEEMVQALAEH